MPDLLEPADARRGDRPLIADEPLAPIVTPASNAGGGIVAPTPPGPPIARAGEGKPAAARGLQSVLLFEQVSKWYGPVIGVNQVTLELRPGITGLVGHN